MYIKCKAIYLYKFENGTAETHTSILRDEVKQKKEAEFGKVIKILKMY